MAITAKDVQTLREMTGVGMMDCKKALTASDGNMDKAVEWLREKGMAASAKKAGRIAAEGMAYATVVDGVGVVVEVNAETDFVGKNEKFVDFVKGVAATVAKEKPADLDALMDCKFLGNGLTVQAAAAGDGAGHRREHQGPPLCLLYRGHLRALCPRRRQDRRAGEPGDRPARREGGGPSARTWPCRSPL